MNEYLPVATAILGGLVGYIVGVARDRLAAVRSKQIEIINDLHEKVLEIENMELSDGQSFTLAVIVDSRSDQSQEAMSNAQAAYLDEQVQWREKLRTETRSARLWIDDRTVGLVSSYFFLMMHCQSWTKFGQGRLTDDPTFLRHVRSIFGKTTCVMRNAVTNHSVTGEPWSLDCVRLSRMCLQVIQRRILLEIAHPLLFRMKSYWWRFREWRTERIANRIAS